MANTLFIGEQYLKEKTVLSKNIDIDLIVPNIEFAQDNYIQSILGSTFYKSLQSTYSNQTLNVDEIDLVELIKPVLAYRASEASLPFVYMQIRNKGINKLNSENATPADFSEMKYLRELLISRSEFYEQRLINYLNLNGSKFPDYISSTSTDIAPNSSLNYDCDLFTGNYNSNNTICKRCGNYQCRCY